MNRPMKLFGVAVAAIIAVESVAVASTDGHRLETAKWQAAIDAASAAGGGVVEIPAGDHPTGMLRLKSNVELRLQEGARLVASGDPADYKLVKMPGSAEFRAVVAGVSVTNVAVTGKGEIFGNAWAFDYANRSQPKPSGVLFIDCRMVRLDDFTLRDAAGWGVDIKKCEDMVIRRVKVDSHAGVCTDGIDIEGRNILIEDCDVDSGDDAICVKSHDVGYPVENIVVRGCSARSHCNAFKIGTATHGVIRNVSFVHCRAFAARRVYRDLAPMPKDLLNSRPVKGAPWYLCGPGFGCINVECVDGGLVENIVVDDIEMEGYRSPIFIRGGDRRGFNDSHADTSQGRWFTLRNVVVSNVRGKADGRTPSTVTGAGRCRPCNIVLKDIDLEIPGEGENRKPYSWPGDDKAGAYPQTTLFDSYHLPAYGLFVDKADGVRMDNVKFRHRSGTTDSRPAICEK